MFLGSNMVRNESFSLALSNTSASDIIPYELCLVCSDPNSKDALSDIGFTVSNFVLFPLNAASMGLSKMIGGSVPGEVVGGVYIAFSGLFGFLLPFSFFQILSMIGNRNTSKMESIHVRSRP